jgi:hypothetical protein
MVGEQIAQLDQQLQVLAHPRELGSLCACCAALRACGAPLPACRSPLALLVASFSPLSHRRRSFFLSVTDGGSEGKKKKKTKKKKKKKENVIFDR